MSRQFQLLSFRTDHAQCACGSRRETSTLVWFGKIVPTLAEAWEHMTTDAEGRRFIFGYRVEFRVSRDGGQTWSGNLFQQQNIPVYDSP